jgi:ubiquinone/menaquinone biosynthesis C-methylase UbiE
MTTDLKQTRAAWSELAHGYDSYVTPTHLWLGSEGIERAGLKAGESFLDIAAGSGALTIPAARRGASVVATDVSPAMLDQLAKRAADEGLPGIQTRVMDGHALEFAEDSFDVAGSQFGVMLFPDLPRALRQMRRVVKPGGRVLITAYGPPARIEFLTFFLGAVKAVVPEFAGLPGDPPPLEFQIADPEILRARLEEAGLASVRIETVTETLRFGSAGDFWAWIASSNPIGARLVASLSAEQQATTREVLSGMLRERANGSDHAELTNPVNIGVGIK